MAQCFGSCFSKAQCFDLCSKRKSYSRSCLDHNKVTDFESSMVGCSSAVGTFNWTSSSVFRPFTMIPALGPSVATSLICS
jgi:hypothetical protein